MHIEAGDCFLIPSGSGSKQHIFTVVFGPCQLPQRGSADQVVMLSFTSVRPEIPYDNACLIQAGEHEFVKHLSYVYYREPRIEQLSHVIKMLETGTWRSKAKCSPELLKRIFNGAKQSSRAPRYLAKILEGA